MAVFCCARRPMFLVFRNIYSFFLTAFVGFFLNFDTADVVWVPGSGGELAPSYGNWFSPPPPVRSGDATPCTFDGEMELAQGPSFLIERSVVDPLRASLPLFPFPSRFSPCDDLCAPSETIYLS